MCIGSKKTHDQQALAPRPHDAAYVPSRAAAKRLGMDPNHVHATPPRPHRPSTRSSFSRHQTTQAHHEPHSQQFEYWRHTSMMSNKSNKTWAPPAHIDRYSSKPLPPLPIDRYNKPLPPLPLNTSKQFPPLESIGKSKGMARPPTQYTAYTPQQAPQLPSLPFQRSGESSYMQHSARETYRPELAFQSGVWHR